MLTAARVLLLSYWGKEALSALATGASTWAQRLLALCVLGDSLLLAAYLLWMNRRSALTAFLGIAALEDGRGQLVVVRDDLLGLLLVQSLLLHADDGLGLGRFEKMASLNEYEYLYYK